MRVDFVSPPFRGHLHPQLGLARALSPIAEVRVLTTPALEGEVEASGVRCRPMLRGRDAAIAAIVNPDHAVRSNPWRLRRQFRATLQFLAEMRAELLEEWRKNPPDLVIVDSVLPVAGYAAAALGIAWWTSLASPCVLETRRGAPAYLGGLMHREDPWGRARDAAGSQLVRGFKRLVVALHRRELRALGLPRLYRENGDEAVYSPECILGLGMRELEFPREWPAALRLIGPVLYTPPIAAPVEIELEPGRAHVLATFGTHLGWIKDRLACDLRRAAEERRSFVVHFSDGAPGSAARDMGGADAEASPWFRRHAYVPYDRWLERFDLVLHHGGAGVMYHCIRAARPSLVYPIDYDQFDHAARIERAGIGRRVRDFARIGEEIEHALRDPPREACARMRAQLGRYRAEETACSLVEQWRPARRRLQQPSGTIARPAVDSRAGVRTVRRASPVVVVVKRALIISFVGLALLGGAWWAFSDAAAAAIVRRGLRIAEEQAARRDVALVDVRFRDAKFAGATTIACEGLTGRVRLARGLLENEPERLGFEIDRVEVTGENVFTGATSVDVRGAVVDVLDLDAAPTGERISGVRVRAALPWRWRDPAGSAAALERELRELVRTGRCGISAQISADVRFAIGRDWHELTVRSRIVDGHTVLELDPQDVRRVSQNYTRRLTDAEIELVARHPVRAPALLRLSEKATASALAMRARDRGFPYDAYRHVYWSWLLTREFGAEFSEEVTDAHEINPTYERGVAARRMDLANNAVGRDYALTGVPESEITQRMLSDPRVVRAAR